jgi:hypothetical protein
MSIFSNRYADAKQDADEYTRAVLGLVGDRDPIGVLERTPTELARVLDGLSSADLARPEEPGKWSMARVIRHLADSEIVWAYRLRRVVAEDRPTIAGYDQDRWADRLHYDQVDISGSLEEVRAVRGGNLRLIRALGPEERARVGMHTERGEESVEHLIRLYAGHDLLHLNQLARIRKRLGLPAPG